MGLLPLSSKKRKRCRFVPYGQTRFLDYRYYHHSKESINIVKSNIKKARVENESTILNLDFKNAIDRLKIQNKKFDIIFMDPPYYKNMFIDALSSIDEADLLCDDGIIVVEHDTKDKFVDKIGRLEKTRDKKYGNTTLTFYKLEE